MIEAEAAIADVDTKEEDKIESAVVEEPEKVEEKTEEPEKKE